MLTRLPLDGQASVGLRQRTDHRSTSPAPLRSSVLLLIVIWLVAMAGCEFSPRPLTVGIYSVEQRLYSETMENIRIEAHVESMKVLEDFSVAVNVQWRITFNEGVYNMLRKYSDYGNNNVYLMDDRGHSYDLVAVSGGAAGFECVGFTWISGFPGQFPIHKMETGVYQFGPVEPEITALAFFDMGCHERVILYP